MAKSELEPRATRCGRICKHVYVLERVACLLGVAAWWRRNKHIRCYVCTFAPRLMAQMQSMQRGARCGRSRG